MKIILEENSTADLMRLSKHDELLLIPVLVSASSEKDRYNKVISSYKNCG